MDDAAQQRANLGTVPSQASVAEEQGSTGYNVSAYQPDVVPDPKTADPATAPGGTFYDPYPTAQPNQQVTQDPWAQDFQTKPDPGALKAVEEEVAKIDPTPATPLTVQDIYKGEMAAPQVPAAAKERFDMRERHPIVEVPKVPEVKEVHETGEKQVEALYKEHTQLPQPVTHMGQTLVTNAEPEKIKIQVPITQEDYVGGFKFNISYAIRWLVEQIKKMGKQNKQVVFEGTQIG